jgi:hypothetical protein
VQKVKRKEEWGLIKKGERSSCMNYNGKKFWRKEFENYMKGTEREKKGTD